MEGDVSELCYKGTILQRNNNRKRPCSVQMYVIMQCGRKGLYCTVASQMVHFYLEVHIHVFQEILLKNQCLLEKMVRNMKNGWN